ncbi:S-adenosyl-L-methionine-dependent methyltransferase [Penicillium verhagenii]|uniref:S-adenosyl-L-methionine-dependent methyltransferase n=1 Tax=Penicillium verhagenii TaxID=1562060 RepID=UPI0025450F47|nr:S-adenosyl-L-methionine-dependent methyltransferase [Penicillium verhagenii]KAJ5939461.1 S-adenosyl-L-methionine-dependent methyltransferase [Penicillium verhagenii]
MSTFTDPTFTKYTNDQAQNYAKLRGTYADPLFNIIIDHHAKTGGNFQILADVGCGPGNATKPFAHSFDHAIGLDPAIEMINTAQKLGGKTAIGEPITYCVSGAESIAYYIQENMPFIEENGGVDMITAAMAAHWFNMPKFWSEATQIVKSGGSVALWTHSSLFCHPSTPNAEQVQNALFYLEREILAPYELPENRLSRDYYDNLALPWTITNKDVERAFPKSGFVRMIWDRDGVLTDGENFFSGSDETTASKLADSLQTASMVTRWRKAHPDLVDTDQDCVALAMAELRKALGVSEDEDPMLKVGSATVLLLFKRE